MDNHYSKSHKKSYITPERMKIGTHGDCRVIDGFKWNIYDVCINPEEIVICDDKVKFLIICLAKTDYSWEYGISAGVGRRHVVDCPAIEENLTTKVQHQGKVHWKRAYDIA